LGGRPTLRRAKRPPHGFGRLKTTAFTKSHLQQKKDLTHAGPGRAAGYLPSPFVEPLFLMLHGGGWALEDLRRRRSIVWEKRIGRFVS